MAECDLYSMEDGEWKIQKIRTKNEQTAIKNGERDRIMVFVCLDLSIWNKRGKNEIDEKKS